ncbi:hypothetical protein A5714_01275 [Mycobacterium sp. E2462]|uniref:hypothetical protein n=1 Tax=unclassified Mycobacterium TaxID=2642494 RepID=UPI0008022DDC|nr:MULTISPECIES: hypothetical protein [unclassified Mycobacterium]OBG71291.1 hypothetical protein A5700_11965 [Mycobacterium sp. E1214]OBH28659.1 hypothetical protein A5693_21280 [Mycobacterium sp. E1319]OBI15041.1 hypothetical protein A5714_01275 [Mycobacterium sp. E2462]
MAFRRRAGVLLAGSLTAAALTCGAGTALASPDPGQPPDLPSIDEWQIQFPTTMTNPLEDAVGSSGDWGGVGMYCENLHANCG